MAREQQVNGKPLIEEPHFRARLADVEMELMSLEMTNLRTVAAAEAGGVPGAESSFLKIMGTELRQEITDLFRRAAGPTRCRSSRGTGRRFRRPLRGTGIRRLRGQPLLQLPQALHLRGSNEIQKNIISKMILGL